MVYIALSFLKMGGFSMAMLNNQMVLFDSGVDYVESWPN